MTRTSHPVRTHLLQYIPSYTDDAILLSMYRLEYCELWLISSKYNLTPLLSMSLSTPFNGRVILDIFINAMKAYFEKQLKNKTVFRGQRKEEF